MKETLILTPQAEFTKADGEYGFWGAAQINKQIINGSIQDLVNMAEGMHSSAIVRIASGIQKSHAKLILIAGPSSSGKTTFAKRLTSRLANEGTSALYLGIDDYYKDRDDAPVDADGKKNFDTLESIDTALLEKDVTELLAGGEADLPSYDFIEGVKAFGKRITSLEENQIIVVEGIHALNTHIFGDRAEDEKFKIYISPLTQLSADDRRISNTDARLLRRIVRDARTRGTCAADSISQWPKVREGEDLNIFPYCGVTDVIFDTSLIYELPALKPHAEPLLTGACMTPAAEEEKRTAERLLAILNSFVPFGDENIIPANSLLREFIGGGLV